MADSTAPTLLSLVLTDTVDVGTSPVLKLSANAIDSDGINFISIAWDKVLSTRSDAGFEFINFGTAFYPADNWTSGTRMLPQTVQKINEVGTYTIQSVSISDKLHNMRSYSNAELTALGFDTSFTVTGATLDRSAPVLDSLAIPTEINTSNGPVRWEITAGATDELSKVERIDIAFEQPFAMSLRSDTMVRPGPADYMDLSYMTVFGQAGSFSTGSASTSTWVAARNGIYNIREVIVIDAFRNEQRYDASAIQKLGMPTHITVSDGTYVAPKLTTSVASAAATVGQDGAIVLKVASDAFKTGVNTVELTVRYNASLAHFDTWSAGSTATSAAQVKQLESGSYGEATLTGTIEGTKDGVIELRFKPLAANGNFTYDVTGITFNGQVLANSFNQSLAYRIQTLREGSAGADKLSGDGRDDLIQGGAGNDVMIGAGGMDELKGGAGTDTALYAKARGLYKVERSGAELVVSNLAEASDVDRLNSVEILQFADFTMAFDPTGDAAQVYRLYKAAFDRAPDAAGFGFWVHAREAGVSLHDIANGFVASAEFTTKYGAAATKANYAGIVKGFYENVLDRIPDAAGTAFWEGVLERKAADVGDVLIGFADSAENQASLASLIGQGMSYIPYG